MFLRSLVGSLLILATGVLPTFGQMRSNAKSVFTIAGSVRDESTQRTMENIRVDLKEATGVTVRTVVTGGNGEFEINGLSSGDYSIEVTEKGYESVRQAVTIFNSSTRGVTIFLSRPVTVVDMRAAGSISAHQLSAPRKAHDEFDKGNDLLYSKSDVQGAIVEFQRAIKDFPTYYEAYEEEGEAYLRLKQVPQAEEALRKSIDFSAGKYPEALFSLATLLTETNRYEEATTTARQGIKADPSTWRGPFELARALSGLKQQDEAEKSAMEARDLKPDNPFVYLMLANIHIQRRDYPALSKDLDAYLKLVPSGPEADQARKTQVELQAALQEAETRPKEDVQAATPHIDAPPPPEPDSSGLPSLPPPVPDSQ